MRRGTSKALMIALIGLVAGAVACSDGNGPRVADPTARVVAAATVIQEPDSNSILATPAPDSPEILPERSDCASIRGTEYRSNAEREWFRANCIDPTALPNSAASSEVLCYGLPIPHPVLTSNVTVQFSGGLSADENTYDCSWVYEIPSSSTAVQYPGGAEPYDFLTRAWTFDVSLSGSHVQTWRPLSGAVPPLYFDSPTQSLQAAQGFLGDAPYSWRYTYTESRTTDPLPPSGDAPSLSQGQPAWLLLGNSSLVADDGEFLGNVTCNQFESDGIFNRFGDYGSRFSSMSIWNRFGTYGGQFGTESPFNQFATPPFIQGIGLYLAEGRSFTPRVSPTELVNWCFEAGSADSEYWLGLIGD